jgi:leucyl-tRNA synthetase
MSIMLRIMNPVCPHISEFIWAELGFAKVHGAILDGAWPEVHDGALVKEELELMLQVNGKLRGSLVVPVSASKEEIEALALAHEATVRLLAGARPKKVIVVSGRLVNVVI